MCNKTAEINYNEVQFIKVMVMLFVFPIIFSHEVKASILVNGGKRLSLTSLADHDTGA